MEEATVVTDRDAFVGAAEDQPPGTRIPAEIRFRVDDPFAAYRRARSDGGAYLATTGGQTGWGYFGVDPVERLTVSADAVVAEAHEADSTAGSDPPGSTDSDPRTRANAPASDAGGAAAETTATGAGSAVAPTAGADQSPTLAALQAWLDGESLVRAGCDVPYPCGGIGWLSYDVARELESLPDASEDDRELPRLQLECYDRLAAWAEPRGEETTLRITACPRLRGDESPTDTYDRGLDRALALVDRIQSGDPDPGPPPIGTTTATFESDCGQEAFAERVRRVKEYVRAGDTFQANVSQRLVAPAAVHPVAAFDALRRVNPAPYSALLEFPAADLVSASPELLLDRDGRRLVTEPIAGTRPRGDDPDEDRRLAADLTGDEKERAEHAMLVDLERNDLGKVSTYGSVDVTEYRRVDRYSEVMHLVSLVEGDLRPSATLADAVGAVFPGGTITGAPKPRTMEIIDELEAVRRGAYTGSIGIFGFDDRATLNIVIRTLVRYGDEYHLRVGAGIVHDSVPEREYEETLDKARALITAVDEALGDRAAMAVDDSAGATGARGQRSARAVDGGVGEDEPIDRESRSNDEEEGEP